MRCFCLHRGCFLTSSLIGTLALSLTIPLSVLADICMQKVILLMSYQRFCFPQCNSRVLYLPLFVWIVTCGICAHVFWNWRCWHSGASLANRCVSLGCFSPGRSPSSSPSSSPRSCAITTTGIRSWWGCGEFTSLLAGNIAFTGTLGVTLQMQRWSADHHNLTQVCLRLNTLFVFFTHYVNYICPDMSNKNINIPRQHLGDAYLVPFG